MLVVGHMRGFGRISLDKVSRLKAGVYLIEDNHPLFFYLIQKTPVATS